MTNIYTYIYIYQCIYHLIRIYELIFERGSIVPERLRNIALSVVRNSFL
jgi:hypothetical protein